MTEHAKFFVILRIGGIATFLLAAFGGMVGMPRDAAAASPCDEEHTITRPAQFSSASDLVTVVDNNNNGEADSLGDAWLYDADGNGSLNLGIVFQEEDDGLTAYVYDDADGSGRVEYDFERCTIKEPYWRVKVVSRSGTWLQADGTPNWNLDVLVDSGYGFTGANADFLLDGLSDGTEDIAIRYWDADGDSVPEAEFNDKNLARPYDAIIHNNNPNLSVTGGHEEFPLLGSGIVVDWQTSAVVRLQHLIPTRTNEAGYFIYFMKDFDSGVRYGWESPFAFYDLQGDEDGLPEMAIRLVSGEYASEVGYYHEARYTWAQTREAADYRLYLIGRNEYTDVVSYPVYPVSHVPYEKVPYYVTDAIWSGAIFAEDEKEVYGSLGEGIYENGEFASVLREKVLEGKDAPLPEYIPTNVGLREEYNFAFDDSPRLYFSPVDRRLHLVGAEKGILILSADTVEGPLYGGLRYDFTARQLRSGDVTIHEAVEYADIDGDGYLDQWTHLREGQPEARLVQMGELLIYWRGQRLLIKKPEASLRPALFEMSPPRDSEEWADLQSALAAHTGTRESRPAAKDLKGMFDSAEGETFALNGISLLSVSPRPYGFGLLVELQEGFEAPVGLKVAGEESLATGQYFLRYDGAFSLQEATPPRLEIGPGGVSFELEALDDLHSLEMSATVVNGGIRDAEEVLVRFYQGEPGRGGSFLGEETTHVPGEASQTVSITWVPKRSGNYVIYVEASAGDAALGDQSVAIANAAISVSQRSMPDIVGWLDLSSTSFLPALVALAAMALLVSALVLLVLAKGTEGMPR